MESDLRHRLDGIRHVVFHWLDMCLTNPHLLIRNLKKAHYIGHLESWNGLGRLSGLGE